MREVNDPSMQALPRSARMNPSLLLAVALPLCSALACGGSNTSSQVDGAGGLMLSLGGGVTIDPMPGAGNAGTSNGTGGTGSVTGPYMLPAGFTPATLGGFKLGAAIDGTMMGAAGASTGTPGSSCGTEILGVVRDFKGINEPMGHPDFEHFQGDAPSPGIVSADLGTDQKPVYTATGPFIDPKYGQQTTSKMAFDQWYRATADVNKPYIVYFYFQPNNGVLTFQSNAFFPLDGAGWGNSCNEPDATCKKQPHNFGFTTEVHTKFNYKGGETFAFTGDDDLWVFINNKLAIDLGGLHPQASLSVSLDTAAAMLGIKKGMAYNLDLFHAERHTDASNFRVDTNLEFTNCGTIIAEPPPR